MKLALLVVPAFVFCVSIVSPILFDSASAVDADENGNQAISLTQNIR